MGGGHRAGPSGHLAATQPSRPDQALRLATRAWLLSLAGLCLPLSPLLSAWLQTPFGRRPLGGHGRATGLAKGSVSHVSGGRVGLRPVSLETRPPWTVMGILRTESWGVLCDESGRRHSIRMDSAEVTPLLPGLSPLCPWGDPAISSSVSPSVKGVSTSHSPAPRRS